MKSRIFVLMSTITVFAVLGIRIRVAAQDQQEQKAAQPHRYSVTALSTLGGSLGVGQGINNKGWVAGAANLTGDKAEHATLWRNGGITDLLTLGGPDSFLGSKPNDKGVVVGYSETSTLDPLGENFCAASFLLGFNTGLTCLGFLWQNGAIAPLPPLPGGNNSFASAVNNRGQVVGIAENSTHDPTCIAPTVLQFEAVMWRLKQDQIIQIPQELPPLDGDPDGAAFGINDKGQAAGCSGTCGMGGVHAVVWENGSPTDIGGLGPFNCAFDINNRGQVIGESILPDNTTSHSFLWENGVITDLGALPGDVCGGRPCVLIFAGGINNKGQVVGHTCDATDTYCTAFLWQNGVMTDLNTLVPPDSSLFLAYAADINDRGEIVGQAIDLNNPAYTPAFLAIPCDEENADDEGCQAASQASVRVERPKAVLPENVREQLRRRMLFGRFRSQLGGAR